MKIAEIAVGERYREDLGDVGALAASLKQFGQLQPIIVDDVGQLIDGERRIRAAELLGWTEIEAIDKGDLTEEQRREIEIEANAQRKQLTAIEASKHLAWKAQQAAAAIAAKRLSAESAESPRMGRPPKQVVARSEVADALGVGETTIREAEQHVAAVEAFPELEPLPQQTAIEAASELRALPEREREQVREAIQQLTPDERRAAMREAAKSEAAESSRLMAIVGDPDGRIASAALIRNFSKAIHSARSNLLALNVASLAAVLDGDHRDMGLRFVRDARTWLDGFESAFEGGLRLMERNH